MFLPGEYENTYWYPPTVRITDMDLTRESPRIYYLVLGDGFHVGWRSAWLLEAYGIEEVCST
jgi:hypothetical protein